MTSREDSPPAVADSVTSFEDWLACNDRSGWIEPFQQLQATQPHVLAWADADDLIAIFTRLGPCNEQSSWSVDDLAALFGQQLVISAQVHCHADDSNMDGSS
jgi:hypothetical protein